MTFRIIPSFQTSFLNSKVVNQLPSWLLFWDVSSLNNFSLKSVLLTAVPNWVNDNFTVGSGKKQNKTQSYPRLLFVSHPQHKYFWVALQNVLESYSFTNYCNHFVWATIISYKVLLVFTLTCLKSFINREARMLYLAPPLTGSEAKSQYNCLIGPTCTGYSFPSDLCYSTLPLTHSPIAKLFSCYF